MATATDRTTPAIYLHPSDNICVAARTLDAGLKLDIAATTITLSSLIKIGHKIAIAPIAKGSFVYKYGQIIGTATCDIAPGDHVHSHNLTNGDFVRDYAKSQAIPAALPPITDRTFLGYRRADGKAGTRNYIAVISTVNCSASVSKYIANRFDQSILKDYPSIDGVIALKHGGGCGLQYGGLQHQILARTLGGMAKHPNIGGFLLIGLGCENAPMGYLLDSQKLIQIDGNKRNMPPVLSMQDLGGTAKTVEAGIRMLGELLPKAADVKRVPIPASEIILGTNCGGSDGNSGVTCNPALGVASDLLVRCGGTTALAETTEIYGAEHLLTRRARTPEVADKLLERIDWWLWHTKMYGVEIDNNPSVGNKEGGLTTIAEKSLGAVAKTGTTALEEVYHYAEPMTAKGFVVMDTPGFDPPSVTGLVAGGANVVVFTTGRGSCFGCKPVPSIKVASNTPMYERMIDDMDINSGEVLHGQSLEAAGQEIFEKILSVASGEKTKSEQHGIGDEEFVPWQVGPTL
ncbi:Altronate dehydratase [Pirellula staleyi DSM 6068]|uniref:Altronate dehydratase n=1 Tax=Pirellula staleyi (strain ATCC 27377 / DSM 6068 / ICPB 4128) TaxID=530564 RepID=D2QZ01_PIRSD|nr:altronate dehydratase family protein [Pirellula staleyi]ADB16456.1 Altronate dehydratase [Pirellula staleyi DSM 6068]